jgi:hypothetical protein
MSVVFRAVVMICAALALGGCGRSASFRYKLSLSLFTPDGVKSGYSVVAARFAEFRIPERGLGHGISGQGIYIDLGPGRRPLIALLTSKREPNQKPEDIFWDEGIPFDLFTKRCLGLKTYEDAIAVVSDISACTTPLRLSTAELPDIVTFADVNDPRSIMKVDPENLSATFGPGVAWREMTLQWTDEPITSGIEKQLPWVDTYQKSIMVPGFKQFGGLPLAISRRNFKRSR